MSRRFCAIVSLLMSALLLPAVAAGGASIEGRWSGPAGTAVLTQDGNAIVGDAALGNGETANVVGVILGNKVYYSYSRSSGAFGTGTMTLSEDGNELDSTYAEPDTGSSGQWKITRDAAGTPPATTVQLAGTWNSNLGKVVFKQTGKSATAKITFVNGHTGAIKGELRDRTFEFTFELDDGGRGNGQGTVSDDGAVMSGTYTKMPGDEQGEWILVRPGPVPCGLPNPAAE